MRVIDERDVIAEQSLERRRHCRRLTGVRRHVLGEGRRAEQRREGRIDHSPDVGDWAVMTLTWMGS